jgi:hypothetical protein
MISIRTLVLLVACCGPAAYGFAAVSAPPETAAPAAQYRSAFEGYRSYRDEPVADWRSVNDDVARAGGHIGIMRGAAPAAARGARTEAGEAPARGAPKAPAGHAH